MPHLKKVFRAYKSDRPVSAFFETNVRRVVEFLEDQKHFNLTNPDKDGIRHIAQAFFKSGPGLSYSFIGSDADSRRMPTYSELMMESDGTSRNWNFLASDDQFQRVQRMQKNNLIIPLVGDFAGPQSIRSVAEYVRKHRSTVRIFYTSNVEEYLFKDERKWQHFYDNALLLPTDSTSSFIRYVLNSSAYDRRRTTLVSAVDSTMATYRYGVIRGYEDIVRRSR